MLNLKNYIEENNLYDWF